MPKLKTESAHARAWGLFLYTHSLLLERIEGALSAAELPALSWYDVLWELEKAPEGKLRMHELAERIVLPRYNLTRLADRLQEASLLQREDCLDDRRGYFLVITTAGRRMRKRMWEVYEPLIAELFSVHLTQAQANVMAEAFVAIARKLRESDASRKKEKTV